MRRALFRMIVLSLGVIMITTGALSRHITYPEREANESLDNQDAVLRPLQTALAGGGFVGRLYYQGVCDDKIKGFGPRFPKIAARQPQGRGLAAVQSVFGPDTKDISVVGDAGVVRITVGYVPDLILKTKVAVVKFTPEDQYNEVLAIAAIEDAPEVHATMERHGIRTPITTLSYPMRMPAPGLPHLPEYLSNLTVDQALDEVARTFGGVVHYGECNCNFYISFSTLGEFDDLTRPNSSH